MAYGCGRRLWKRSFSGSTFIQEITAAMRSIHAGCDGGEGLRQRHSMVEDAENDDILMAWSNS